jgi:hypothetical protein
MFSDNNTGQKQQPQLTSNHSNTGISSMADVVDTLDGSENILLVDTDLASLLQVVGKDVEQQLRVRVGVDMAMGILIHERTELVSIDQVSVLRGVQISILKIQELE